MTLLEISREEDQVGPCGQLYSLSPFNPLSEMQRKKTKKVHGQNPSPPRKTTRSPQKRLQHPRVTALKLSQNFFYMLLIKIFVSFFLNIFPCHIGKPN